MKFEAKVTLWVQTDRLDEADEAIQAAAAAAYERLGTTAIDDPELHGMYSVEFHGIDDEAVAALTEDDLGPGRFSTAFRYGPS